MTIGLAALITMVFAAGLGRVAIVIDPDATLPQTHPFVIATNLADKLFGNKFTVVIGLSPRAGDVLQPEALRAVSGITERLAREPGVVGTSIVSLAARKAKDIAGSEDALEIAPLVPAGQGPADAAALRAALARNPIYTGLIVSPDLGTTAVIAEFAKDSDGFRAIAARVEAIVAPFRSPALEIMVGGQPILLGQIEVFSDRMAFLFPLALVVIGLIHFEAFRSWQGVFLPLVTGLVAVSWALGIMGWLRIPLDAFNVTTPILILAVAAGHAVQILKRYYEEFQSAAASSPSSPAAANREAVVRALVSTGPVMIAAGLTAAASFLSLLLFEISTIRVFGLFTALGICSALAVELTLIPALRAMLPPPGRRQMEQERRPSAWRRLAEALTRLAVGRPRMVIALSIVVLAIAIACASLVRVDNSLRAFFRDLVPARQQDEKLNARLAGTHLLTVIVQGDAEDAIKSPGVLKGMDAIQRAVERDPAVGKTVSIVDFVRQIDRALNADPDRARALPADQNLVAQLLLLYSMSGDPTDFNAYVDTEYRNAAITIYLKQENSAFLEHFIARLRNLAREALPAGVRVSIGGNVTSSVALNEVLVGDKLLNIAQIAASVLVISTILFRSLIGGLLVLVPMLLAVAVNFGLMGAAGIPLQVATATVSAMAVGIGADYAIYFLYRLREEQAKSADLALALERSFTSAGAAVIYVATAIAGGYAVMILSWDFMIHVWLGLLISTAMLVSAAAALTTLPALVVLLRPRFLAGARPAAALAAACLLASMGSAQAQQPTAEQIMQRNFVALRTTDSSADAVFTLIGADGQQRVRRTQSWTRLRGQGNDNMRLIRFLSPPDVRGTATLMQENSAGEDDIWVYLPALKRVRRLLAANKKDSFIGTDFSYGDIIGLRVEEWRHSLVRTEPVDGVSCYVVESTPATAAAQDTSGYSKRVQWIRTDNFVTVKGQYFDSGNRLWKTFSASDIRPVQPSANRWQPMHLETVNVQTGHRTIIQFENFKAGLGLSESLFSPRVLEQER